MADPTSRIVIALYAQSFDGRYWGRYPLGDKPDSGAELAAVAEVQVSSNATLSTAVRLAAIAQASASGSAALSTAIRLGAAATDIASATAALNESSAQANLLEADFQSRAAGPEVVFLHDFRSQAEVDKFRWANAHGNDPNDVARPNRTRWLSTDGITGGCLEIFRPAASPPEPPEWWRMLSPLTGASNGRGVDDPGASGQLTPQVFNPTNGGSQTANWGNRGFYGHSDYHSAFPGAFDGTSYFLAVNVKMDPRRVENPDGGKIFYFTRTDVSLTSQEIVVISGNVINQAPGQNLFGMYRSGGTPLQDDDPGNSRQPGTSLGVCQTSGGVDISGCWFMPLGEWFQFLFHMVPGHDSGNDTIAQVWVCEQGETSYKLIWNQANVDLPFGAGRPFGHAALIISAYMNSQTFSTDIYHRVCQLIFSRAWIPPRRVYNTASFPLQTAALALAPGQSVAGPGISGLGSGAGSARQTIQWTNRFFFDYERRSAHLQGKDASAGGGDGARSNNQYNATSNTWATSGRFNFGETGHVYESFAYDPRQRRCYMGQWSGSPTGLFYWTVGDPLAQLQTTAVGFAWSSSNHVNPVICWHPNLFGYGDGGVLAFRMTGGANVAIAAYRASTDTWTPSILASTATGGSPGLGAMVYVRAWDVVVATFATGSTFLIGPGNAGTPATGVQIPNPPVPCRHPSGSLVGVLVDDPRGLAGPYVLDKGGSNAVHRLIRNGPGSYSWSTRPYTHPFPRGGISSDQQWVVADCFPLPAFWCVNQTGTPTDMVWRPND